MKVVSYSADRGELNTYLLITKNKDGLAIVDPFKVDMGLFRFIEDNSLPLICVLVTGRESGESHGLRTLRKIYSSPVYAHSSLIDTRKSGDFLALHNGARIKIGPEYLNVLIPGKKSAAVFFCSAYIFSGHFLSAGRMSNSFHSSLHDRRERFIGRMLSSFHPDTIILPGAGPPTNVRTERKWYPFVPESPSRHPRKPD